MHWGFYDWLWPVRNNRKVFQMTNTTEGCGLPEGGTSREGGSPTSKRTDYLEKYGQFFVDKWATVPAHTNMPDFFEWMKSIFDEGRSLQTRNVYKEAADFARDLGPDFFELLSVNSEFRNALYRALKSHNQATKRSRC